MARASKRRKSEPDDETLAGSDPEADTGPEADTVVTSPPAPAPAPARGKDRGVESARLYAGGKLVATVLTPAGQTITHDGRKYVRRIPGVYVLALPGPPQTRHG